MRAAGGGVIVDVSSTVGVVAYVGFSVQIASKRGVRGRFEAAAMGLDKDGGPVLGPVVPTAANGPPSPRPIGPGARSTGADLVVPAPAS